MAMKPAAGGDEILRWFWAETAMASSCGGFAIAWTPPTTRARRRRRSASPAEAQAGRHVAAWRLITMPSGSMLIAILQEVLPWSQP